MKKRAMKKWIPKDTCYCYGHRRTSRCKWLSFNKNKDSQENGYCKYIKEGDWYKNGTMLLWDECKSCGEHEETKRYWLREYKNSWRYK